MKNPTLIISVAVIVLATIAGSVILTLENKDASSLVQLLVTGIGLATATGVIGSKQVQTTSQLSQ